MTFYKPAKPYPNLKAKREKLGISRAQFSRIVGVSDTAIARAEAGGKVKEDTYRWIEEALK
jgi:predicted transcriptional regulator